MKKLLISTLSIAILFGTFFMIQEQASAKQSLGVFDQKNSNTQSSPHNEYVLNCGELKNQIEDVRQKNSGSAEDREFLKSLTDFYSSNCN